MLAPLTSLLAVFPLLAFEPTALAISPCAISEPRGTETIEIDSKILERRRKAYVALPASYHDTKRRYPVILVLDGEANFELAVTVVATLARLGHAPEAIVVGVPNVSSDPSDRVHDLTPPGLSVSGSSLAEGGDRFLDFLELELLPRIAEDHRGGKPAILIGHSSGGVLATYAAATRPGFAVVVSIDAPMFVGDGWLADRLLERAKATEPKPLRFVSAEASYGWTDARWSTLLASAPASWRLHREKLAGESHETAPFLAMYQGLKFAFADYSIVGAPLPPRGPAQGAFDVYAKIERELGAELPPPEPVLRRLIEDLLTEASVEAARHALRWLVAGYGEPRDLAELEGMIARVAALPPLAETVESLRATLRPSPAEIAAYVGTWRGRESPNEEFERELTIRVRVEDGRAIVESHERRGTDAPLAWRAFEYVRVLPDGIEFGRLNGMRPRGMWIWKGKRAGDVLAGGAGFRGIVVPLPDGHMPPVFRFRIQREAE